MANILVVDDSPFIVDIFVTMLKRAGYTAESADGGPAALEKLKTFRPDLIMLDIIMEPMDGWETLLAIKQDPTFKDIPVMMLTAKQITPQEAEVYGIYIEDYILKPVTHNDLCAAIDTILTRIKNTKEDVELGRKNGYPEPMIQEYKRLVHQVSVSRRLIKLLESAYQYDDMPNQVSGDIKTLINNMSRNLTFQNARLIDLRETFARPNTGA